MITDRRRYEARHAHICERAERDYLDQRKTNSQFTVGLAVKAYAVAVRCAIVKRDLIAAVYAAQCAHVVRKFGSVSRFKAAPVRLHCRHGETIPKHLERSSRSRIQVQSARSVQRL
jgi:hypothetical protein